MTASQRNASISIKSLLSIISNSGWEPLDTEVTAKVTGYKARASTAAFRRMIGIANPRIGSGYSSTVGEVFIDNIADMRVARCYGIMSHSHPTTGHGGHRIFWRAFPSGVTDDFIVASARAEVCGHAFLTDRPAVFADSGGRLFTGGRTVEPVAAVVAPKTEAASEGPSIVNMTNDELIIKIKALRIDLEALEAERSTRLQAAADLIERLKS
jgi:hypothetical protein